MTVTLDVTMVAEVVEAQEVLITNRPTVGEETTVEEVRVGVVLAEKKVEVCAGRKSVQTMEHWERPIALTLVDFRSSHQPRNSTLVSSQTAP